MSILKKMGAALRREPDWGELAKVEKQTDAIQTHIQFNEPTEKLGMFSGINKGNDFWDYSINGLSRTKWDTNKSIKDGFEVLPVVYVCVHRIATAVAAPNYRVYERTAKGLKPAFDSALQRLIDQPNEFMGQSIFTYRAMQHLLLGGNALIHETRRITGRNKGLPLELWLKGPVGIRPIADARKYISGYKHNYYDSDTRTRTNTIYDTKDIIHMQMPHPGNPRWGMAPMMAAAVAADAEIAGCNWQQSRLNNHASPGGILNLLAADEDADDDDLFDKGGDVMPGVGTPEHTAWREAIQRDIQGHTNAGKIVVIDNAIAKFMPLSMTPAEMDFLSSRKFNREDILAVFGTPPPVAGYYENATYRNIDTAYAIFWEQTVLPFVEDYCQLLTLGLAREFGKQYVIRPDLTNITALLPLMERKLKIALMYQKLGYSSDMINAHLELGMASIGDLPKGNKLSLVSGKSA